jgi:hypothetical protein
VINFNYNEIYKEFRTAMVCNGFTEFTRYAGVSCIWNILKIKFVEASIIFDIFIETGLIKKHNDITWKFYCWE